MARNAFPPIFRYKCLAVAKANAPVDSGNLRHNAIKLKNVKPTGFTINYDSSSADYIEYVEEGIGQQAQHFVRNTAQLLSIKINDAISSNKPFKIQYKEEMGRALETSQTNALRESRFLQSQMRSKGINYDWR